MQKEKKLWSWRIVGGLIALVIVSGIVMLNVFFSSGNVERDDRSQINFLDSETEVIVTLNDKTCHIPGCVKIEMNNGSTERLKYGIALGRGYAICPLCIGD